MNGVSDDSYQQRTKTTGISSVKCQTTDSFHTSVDDDQTLSYNKLQTRSKLAAARVLPKPPHLTSFLLHHTTDYRLHTTYYSPPQREH